MCSGLYERKGWLLAVFEWDVVYNILNATIDNYRQAGDVKRAGLRMNATVCSPFRLPPSSGPYFHFPF